MKSLDTIRSGSQPTIFSRKKPILKLESEELDVIDDSLGLSLMYLNDTIEIADRLYQKVSSLESTDEETREAIATIFNTIKEVELIVQNKYDLTDA